MDLMKGLRRPVRVNKSEQHVVYLFPIANANIFVQTSAATIFQDVSNGMGHVIVGRVFQPSLISSEISKPKAQIDFHSAIEHERDIICLCFRLDSFHTSPLSQ